MSLLISVLCMLATMDWYCANFVIFNGLQTDAWSVGRGLAISLFVAVTAHRLTWIILDKIDYRFNNPPFLYTTKNQRNAADRIEHYLNKHGFFVNDDSVYGREEQQAGELFAQKCFSLLYINPFLGTHSVPAYSTGDLQAGRGLDNLPGPLGWIFRFFGEATWYTGDFSVWLQVYVNVFGLDDDCTVVKVRFRNIAKPPIINVWGPWTRTILLRGIRNSIDATEAPGIEYQDVGEEPDVADDGGDPDDSFSLANMRIESGQVQAALAQFRKAAIGGHSEAQFELGYRYLYGIDVDQNLRRARYWLENAVEQGVAEAEEFLQLAEEQLEECGEL